MSADIDRLYAGRRIAVLGATGFIGRHVAAALARRGAEVYLLARSPHAAHALAAELEDEVSVVRCEAAAPGELERAVEKVRPAVAFNLAGYGVDVAERDEEVAALVNAELPRRLCQAMARWRDGSWPGQAVLHVGSALEYGRAGGNLREETEPLPHTLYGRTKLEGTRAVSRACRELRVPGLTARLFTVYGPCEHGGRLLPTLVRAAGNSAPIDLTAGLQRRDFTFVDDVAEGLLRLGATTAPPGTVVNLASATLTPVRVFTERAADVLGIARERLRFGALPVRTAEMVHDPASNERLRELTGWAPATSIEEGVRRTATRARAVGTP